MSITPLDIELYAFSKLVYFLRILNLQSGFSHGSSNAINPSA
jgi:hypothetical protein